MQNKVRKLKRSSYRNAVGALFLAISPQELIQKCIVQPIMLIFTWLAKWASSIELKEGEQAIHVLRYKDGKATIYTAALKGREVRIVQGFDPEGIFSTFADTLNAKNLKESIALSLVPYGEGETPETPEDDDTEMMESLFAQLPPIAQDSEKTLQLPSSND